MKICYLLVGLGMSQPEIARREKVLNRIAAQGTTVEIKVIEDGPRAIENAIDEYQAMPNNLKFALRHQDEYDALIIGCAGDAGLEGAREHARIPIVGPGESSLVLGTLGDKRFSMVTTSPAQTHLVALRQFDCRGYRTIAAGKPEANSLTAPA